MKSNKKTPAVPVTMRVLPATLETINKIAEILEMSRVDTISYSVKLTQMLLGAVMAGEKIVIKRTDGTLDELVFRDNG